MFRINKNMSLNDLAPGSVVRIFMLTSVFVLLLAGIFSFTRVGAPQRAYAATSSNLNYQARLLNSSGNLVPDGYYNLEFKLYSAATGGSALWTERYHDTNGVTPGGDNRVRVVNGYLSVNLGSVTAFPALNWDQDMWLTMNVGGATQTATPVFDGEMSPRIKLTAVPYAFQAQRAEQLTKSIGSYLGILQFPGSLAGNTTYNLVDPGLAFPSVDICLSSGNCAGSGGGLVGSGTAGRLGVFGSSNSLGNSYFLQGPNSVTIDPDKSLVVDTDTFVVDAANNRVGIGTAAPVYKLDVVSSDPISAQFSGRIIAANAVNNNEVVTLEQLNSAIGGSGSILQGGNSFGAPMVIGTNDLQGLTVRTNGAARLSIDNAGAATLHASLTVASTVYAGGAGVSLTGTDGGILKGYSTSGTVNQNDVVVMVNDGGVKAATSTTPRDTRVLGVYRGASGSASGSVAIAAHSPVNATAGAVAIGDQLVVSGEAGRVMVDNNATTGILGYASTAKAAGSPGLVGVRIQIENGQYSPTFTGTVTASGAGTGLSVTNNATVGGNLTAADINATTGSIRTGGTERISNSGNLNNIGSINAAGTLTFGGDTTLRRSAANMLATDDSFSLLGTGSNLTVQGTGTSVFEGHLTVNGNITVKDFGKVLANSLANTYYSSIPNALAQSPMGRSWHDLFAFNRANGTPVFEQSADGSTWTAGTLNSQVFAQTEDAPVSILNGTTTTAARYTWNSANLAWASQSTAWLVLKAPYTGATAANKTVLVETSPDGVAWTARANVSGIVNQQQTIYMPVTGWGDHTRLRITITSANGQPVSLSGLQMLSDRVGSQGLGSEYEFPYAWDTNMNLRTLGSGGTSGVLRIGGNTTNASSGMYFGTDTNLYRSGVGYLRTDGSLQLGGSRLNLLNNSAQLTFGAASDTYLSRLSANTLQASGSFDALGALTQNGVQVCLVSGNCAGVGGNGDILQSGNSFGAPMVIGTNDNQPLNFETNNIVRATLSTAGQLQLAVTGVNGGLQLGGDANANLYRGGTGLLVSSGTIMANALRVVDTGNFDARNADNAGRAKFISGVTGDPNSLGRFYISAGGNHYWGDGTAAPDTNLYRDGVGVLGTGSSLNMAGVLTFTGIGIKTITTTSNQTLRLDPHGTGRIELQGSTTYIDGVGDIYQNGNKVCDTSGNCVGSGSGDILQGGNSFGADMSIGANDAYNLNLKAGGNVVATFTAGGQLQIPTTGVDGGLLLGGDANLYRNAASTLRTSGGLIVDGQLTAAGLLNSTGAIIAQRTNATDRALDVKLIGDAGPRLRVSANGSIAFGDGSGTLDVSLSRNAGNQLTTSGIFGAQSYVSSAGLYTAHNNTTTNLEFRSGFRDTAGNTGNAAFRSGSNTSTGNTGIVYLQSGNATAGNSGNIIIDAGTASGTKGSISIGATNASSVILGYSGNTVNIQGAATIGGSLTVSGPVSLTARTLQVSNTFPMYTWQLNNSMSDVDWKKIADVTLPTGTYQGASFRVNITDANCNHGCSADVIPMEFYVSAMRSGGTVDVPDTGYVSGPVADYVRLVKTATGIYELQVRAPVTHKTLIVNAQVLSKAAGVITYVDNPVNGSTVGDIYMPSLTGYTQRFASVAVGGNLQVGGLTVITPARALQNVTASTDILNAGTLGIARGGTGVNATPANGRLLIGNGTGYTLANLTAGNGISITNGAGSISIAVNAGSLVGDFVSLQGTTPGTAQTGNINVSGTIIGSNFSGSGADLTNLNAGAITTGKLDNARLNDSVALLDRNSQIFTGNNQIFRNAANATIAFVIQNSGSETLFNADTINQRINIGTVTSSARLTVSGEFANANTWTPRTAAEANSWSAIAYGNNLFVAVSSDGTNRVMTSPDGITWTARTAAEANQWRSITYGNGVFVAVASSGTNRVMTSPDGITWTPRTAAEANSWYSVAYGNNTFVAVSFDGTNRVMTSPDGITWTARTAAAVSGWISVAYGNGTFVAIATSGSTNRLMTSPDGITWTTRSYAQFAGSVTYGNGLFVATVDSYSNRLMTSPDGITWTQQTAPESNSWRSVTYGNGLFVAVASDRVITSPDGITWTGFGSAETNSWQSVVYGKGIFAAVSTTGTNRVMTSTGGYQRAMTVNGDLDISGTLRQNGYEVCTTAGNCKSGSSGPVVGGILQGGNTFGAAMIIGTNDNFGLQFKTNGNTALSISNTGNATFDGSVTASSFAGSGANLTNLNAGSITTGKLNNARLNDDVALLTRNSQTFTGNDQIFRNSANSATAFSIQNSGSETLLNADTVNQRINIGGATSSARLTVSGAFSNASTWTPRAAAEANQWKSIVYGNNTYVAVSDNGTNRVMTSPDGITWTSRTAAEANSWSSVTYGNGLFVAVSPDGTNRVMTSPDGITWTPRAVPTSTWVSVTYGNGKFVAVNGPNSGVMTSPDGITWTSAYAGSGNWYSVTYGNGMFVAISAIGTNRVMTSPDGITWTPRTAAELNGWRAVTYGNGQFVAVAETGMNMVMTSPDGITWTSRAASGAAGWNSVTYGGGMFVAVAGFSSGVMTSPDGITWTSRTAAEANFWSSVTYGNGQFVAVAQSGTNRVMTSTGGYQKAMNVNGDVDVNGTIRQNGYEVCTMAGNCKSGGTGDILQGGNSFGVAMALGTNDNFALQFKTNGTTRLTISNVGNATFTGTITTTGVAIGSGSNFITTNGSNQLRYQGTSRNTKKIVLSPEYVGAVLDGTGTGSMTAGHDGTRRENYYKWSTTSGSFQYYNVVITMAVPSDWAAWAPSNALSVNTYNNGAANAGTDVSAIGTAGVTDVNLGAATPASGWSTYNFNLTDVRYTADGMMTLKIRMGAQGSGVAQVGNITLTYLSQF